MNFTDGRPKGIDIPGFNNIPISIPSNNFCFNLWNSDINNYHVWYNTARYFLWESSSCLETICSENNFPDLTPLPLDARGGILIKSTNTPTPTISQTPTFTVTPSVSPSVTNTLTQTQTFTPTPTKTVTLWSPREVPSITVAWWDASQQNYLTPDLGGISLMQDIQGTTNFGLRQAVSNYRPATGVTVNGLNTLSFDGTENSCQLMEILTLV